MSLMYSKDFFDRHNGPLECISNEDFHMILDWLPRSISKGKFLDLACGSGEFGNRLQKLFPELQVYGIDLSLNLLEWGTFSKCQGNALDLPFHSNTFDCIIAAAAFHHFPSIKKAMSECARCLKPGGLFLAYEPNKFHPQRFVMMTDPLRYIFYRNGDHAISPIHFQRILLKHGLFNIRLKYLSLNMIKPGLLAKLNSKLMNILILLRLEVFIPFVAPWFLISAEKR